MPRGRGSGGGRRLPRLAEMAQGMGVETHEYHRTEQTRRRCQSYVMTTLVSPQALESFRQLRLNPDRPHKWEPSARVLLKGTPKARKEERIAELRQHITAAKAGLKSANAHVLAECSTPSGPKGLLEGRVQVGALNTIAGAALALGVLKMELDEIQGRRGAKGGA